MDWNWFFSAVAQSTAAIVGIFAAFIITKIINNQSEYKKRNNEIIDLISKSNKLKEQVGYRYFDWYNKQLKKDDNRMLQCRIRDLFFEHKKYDPVFYYIKLELSDFEDPEPIIELIQETIEYYKDEVEIEKEIKAQIKKVSKGQFADLFPEPRIMPMRPDAVETMRTLNHDRNIQEEKEAIMDVYNNTIFQLNRNCRRCHKFCVNS